ncbi:MAG: phosphate propanoyltransferase [Elusimicrobiota bacterium]
MEPKELVGKLTKDLEKSIKRSRHPVPIGISNRHFHITKEHWRVLFGDAQPRILRNVRQPGQWAGEETLDIEGPKGRITKVRHLGPFRSQTQVEVSRTDAFLLGIEPPVRGSGSLAGAAPIRLKGPRGSLELKEAVLIAQRHIHLSPEDASKLEVADGDLLRVRAGSGGPRELVFEDVLARVSDKFALEFHVDTDEANAAWLKNDDPVHVI